MYEVALDDLSSLESSTPSALQKNDSSCFYD